MKKLGEWHPALLMHVRPAVAAGEPVGFEPELAGSVGRLECQYRIDRDPPQQQ